MIINWVNSFQGAKFVEWHQIVGFHHVARLGSFTRAAGVTFRTQSALTQQVQALEEEFGCPLFERIGKRKLLLTPAGEKLFAFTEKALSEYGALVEEIQALKGVPRGQLRIAAPFTTLYRLLPGFLEDYTRRFPWVEVSLLDRPQKGVVELVKSGEVDFGITLESAVPGHLSKIRLGRVEAVLLVPAGHPLAGAERVDLRSIAQYPLILPPAGSEYAARRKLEALFGKEKLAYRVVMESSNIELSSVYVEIGLGISFATVVRNLPILKQRNLAFVSLDHYFPPEYMALVHRPDKSLPSHKAAFIDLLLGS